MNRRDFLRLGTASGIGCMLGGCTAKSLPLHVSGEETANTGQPLFSGLTRSLHQEYDYDADIEGTIPSLLVGTLYRNGAGLTERTGLRKRALMDGDGMVHAFTFHSGGVRFRNRFVMTEKYREESAAGRYLYPTFSTQAPGGVFQNVWVGGKIKSQAQISVVVKNNRLFAFDESALPYELNPETLDTIGVADFGPADTVGVFSAHSKIDMATGDWLHFGLHYGKKVNLHITIFSGAGKLKRHRVMPLPRYVYMHDYFVSGTSLIFNLQPVEFDLFSFLFGIKSMSDSLSWRPEKGTLLMILDREGLNRPIFLETEASFMWHSLNAYEREGALIAEYVGYRNPDHFIGENAPVYAVMRGERGQYQFPGQLLRYVIDTMNKRVRREVLHAGSLEWPTVNPFHRCRPHRYGYFAKTRGDDFFWSGITRVDVMKGKGEEYFFDDGVYCGEPLFVPAPGVHFDPDLEEEPGWLLTEVFNGHTGKSSLVIFIAERVSDGPVAVVKLRHHLPFSMHGFWEYRS